MQVIAYYLNVMYILLTLVYGYQVMLAKQERAANNGGLHRVSIAARLAYWGIAVMSASFIFTFFYDADPLIYFLRAAVIPFAVAGLAKANEAYRSWPKLSHDEVKAEEERKAKEQFFKDIETDLLKSFPGPDDKDLRS